MNTNCIKLLFFLFPMLIGSSSFSQIDLKASHNGIIQYNPFEEYFSIHYENSVIKTESLILLGHIGFSHSRPNFNSSGFKWLGVPIGLNTVLGKRKNHFEFGIGYWWTNSYKNSELKNLSTENLFKLNLGYRFQNFAKKSIVLRN